MMLKSLNFTKRKTKLCTKTPHAVAPFVLVGVASEIIVSISSKVKIINFYIVRHIVVQKECHAQ